MNKNRFQLFVALHILLLAYSATGILSKFAAGYPVLSFQFILCYAGILVLLATYAIFWQQIIKRLPLTTAYANRAVAIVWGMVWGVLIFGEKLNFLQVAGGCLVLAGVALYAFSESDESAARENNREVSE